MFSCLCCYVRGVLVGAGVVTAAFHVPLFQPWVCSLQYHCKSSFLFLYSVGTWLFKSLQGLNVETKFEWNLESLVNKMKMGDRRIWNPPSLTFPTQSHSTLPSWSALILFFLSCIFYVTRVGEKPCLSWADGSGRWRTCCPSMRTRITISVPTMKHESSDSSDACLYVWNPGKV